jgi:MYXO-CTERM domain-containing protein
MKLSLLFVSGIGSIAWFLCATTSQGAGVQIYTVPATANIYSAGLSSPVAPAGSGAGTLPIYVPVSVGQTTFQFSASGSITENNWGGGGGVYHGPDGGIISGVTVYAYGGLSGFRSDLTLPLAGVFLSDAAPQDPAPPFMDFSSQGLGLDFLTLAPLIGQVFFIGDGQTSGGVTQTFNVPAGATRLYLGCPDSPFGNDLPGAYDDNSGTLNVSVVAVPEPATGALGAIGLALSVMLRRQRIGR